MSDTLIVRPVLNNVKKKIKSVKSFFPQTTFLSLIVRKDKKNTDKELLDIDARLRNFHWVKSVQIRSFSGPYFPVFGPNTEDGIQSEYGKMQARKNSIFRHFSHSVL